MARLYANENFPVEVVGHLRVLGHDVLTTHDAGKSNQAIEDGAVLRFAIETDRCVLTINRKDFIRLHRALSAHPGIIVCTEDRDYPAFAARIDEAIRAAGQLANRLILNPAMGMAAKERKERTRTGLIRQPHASGTHPFGEQSFLFKILSLRSLRSFAAIHRRFQAYPRGEWESAVGATKERMWITGFG